jgi:hypothetical protein
MISFKRVSNLSCGKVVYRVEKSKVLMEETWEKNLDLRLYKERIVYSPDKDSVCTKRGTTEILWNCLLSYATHMWILKNSNDLLDNLRSRFFSHVSSINTFDFSTLYTTLPHDKLETRLKEIIHKAFSLHLCRIKLVSMRYYQRCCYLCLIPWLGIRSNMIYIQTRCCWKPCS